MATRFLEMGLELESSPYGDKAPFAVDKDGNLAINRGAANKGACATDPGAEFINVQRVSAVSTNTTLTSKDSGALIIADSTTSVVVSLPATEKGLTFTLAVGQLTSATGHSFSPVAADKIIYGPTTAVDDKDLICSTATDRVGDCVTVVGDGDVGWYVVSAVGTWAAES